MPADPLPWLLGVARKVLSNERRATSRRTALTERLSVPSAATQDPSDSVAGRIRALEALQQLGAWDREALMLMAWEQLDYASAAQVMDCPVSLFKVRLHRARRKLTQALDLTDPPDALLASRPQEAK